jgi:hypothetical protein
VSPALDWWTVGAGVGAFLLGIALAVVTVAMVVGGPRVVDEPPAPLGVVSVESGR